MNPSKLNCVPSPAPGLRPDAQEFKPRFALPSQQPALPPLQSDRATISVRARPSADAQSNAPAPGFRATANEFRPRTSLIAALPATPSQQNMSPPPNMGQTAAIQPATCANNFPQTVRVAPPFLFAARSAKSASRVVTSPRDSRRPAKSHSPKGAQPSPSLPIPQAPAAEPEILGIKWPTLGDASLTSLKTCAPVVDKRLISTDSPIFSINQEVSYILSEIRGNKLECKQIAKVFEYMKSLEAMTEWPQNPRRVLEVGPLKTHFEETVVPFLVALCASLSVSGNQKNNFFSQLTVKQKRCIFNGLGTLNTLNERNRYAEKKHVRELLKKITIELLLEGKKVHQILGESNPGELLNFLNWISRAIRNGVLDQKTDEMLVKPIYNQALVRIQQWVAMPVTNNNLQSINVRQLGKSFEQINIFLDFNPMTPSDKFVAGATIVHLCSASLIDMVTEEPDRSLVGEAEENRIVTVGSIVKTLNKAVSERIITASNDIFRACTALMNAITAIDYFQNEDLKTLYSFKDFLHNLRNVCHLDRKQYALHKDLLDTLNGVINAINSPQTRQTPGSK